MLKRLTPLGRVLMGFAGLVLVAVAVVFAVTTFGATTLYHQSAANTDEYTWEGGTLLIERGESKVSATCKVVPDSGERRDVSANRPRAALTTYSHDTLQPWFEGSAKITCTEKVKVYEGTIASLRSFEQGHLFSLVILIGVAAPAVGALAVSGAVKRKK